MVLKIGINFSTQILVHIFRSCYDDLKSRGVLVYVEPHTMLEEEMGKSITEIREEAQRYKRGAAIAKTKAQTMFKK